MAADGLGISSRISTSEVSLLLMFLPAALADLGFFAFLSSFAISLTLLWWLRRCTILFLRLNSGSLKSTLKDESWKKHPLFGPLVCSFLNVVASESKAGSGRSSS